ncbi:MAG: DUF2807 domain-containing protein [Chitinophagaceae bacterium]|nr:DUF2807 domain-containing protein [Chitinophagaceae bacterium]
MRVSNIIKPFRSGIHGVHHYETLGRGLFFRLFFLPLVFLSSFAAPTPLLKEKVKKRIGISAPFYKLRIEGDISIVLTNDSVNVLYIESNAHDWEKVKMHLEAGTLVVRDVRDRLFSKLKLHVSSKGIESIQLNGDADISSSELISNNNIRFELNGNIEVKIKTKGSVAFEGPEDVEIRRY